ncbi:MAG: AAA domain-containing protein [Terriglobales bacterium]|jgi:very-short-patch-repair endonuclease
MDGQAATQCHRERLRKVFEFLKAYVEMRYPPVRDIEQQLKVLWLNDLPQHPSVELLRGGTDSEDESENADIVLRITRPNLTACPSPPAAIVDWLKPGWENVDSSVEFSASRNVPDRSERARLERFEDVAERVSIFRRWRQEREEWQVNERPARRSMAAFQAVYEWFGIHEREPEEIEILAGDGLLNCADDGGKFNHPVLLQRLELEFYPEKRNPQFIFRKREQPPELYLEFLRALPGANYRQIASCADELKRTEISPFGGEDTEGFLQRMIQGVFPPSGQLIAPENDLGPHPQRIEGEESGVGGAGRCVPVIVTQNGDRYELSNPNASRITGPITAANLDSSLRRLREHGWEPTFPKALGPTMQRKPVIFMRRRQSGIGRVFDLVLEDIASRVDFPAALLQIVGLAGAVPSDPRDDPSSLSLGNEDEDILLSKAANKEQLEIARQLARRDCVLVQGPPGTGKTHTIANLLGHLLAQGKSVLVTAHTPKALRVLRQKVVEPLQPLCLSVLQNDKQSQDELRQSVRLIHVGLSQDDRLLEREAEKLRRSRGRIIAQLREDRSRLLDAIQDETRAIVFGGNEVRPIDAAKRVKQGVGSSDWIPSPVQLGAVAPLPQAEVVALYQTNARVTPEDERELNAVRPDVATLPTPKQFSELLDEIALLKSQDVRYRADLWNESSDPQQSAQFDRMLARAIMAIEFLRDRAPWQLDAIQAGRDGDEAKQVWVSLTQLIESTWQEVQDCHVLLMAHGPRLHDQRSPHELLPIVDEIIQHIEAGKSFGLLTKLTKPGWQQLISVTYIGNRRPILNEPTDFRAVRALLRTQLIRQKLVERWERQIAAQGGPTAAELGEKPELVCRQFVPQIQACVDWHSATWLALEAEFQQLGFGWSAYLQLTPPQTGNNAELRRLRDAVLGDLERILKARAGWLRLQHLEQVWSECRALVPQTDQTDAVVARQLRQALHEAAPTTYQESYEELVRLKNLEPDLMMRRKLLGRLEHAAPTWASAIQNRHPRHSTPEPPGEPLAAWEWRQMHDELERRANVSIEEVQQRIEHLIRELLDVTAQLVEKLTWVSLIRKTTPDQKQALGSYALMRNKLTKTGRGVQDAEMRAGARREMSVAKGAVPVWIMPLNEVAESFDPRRTRFDVVIIDEASQCDPTAMFALYLGRQTVIVGDDEQVTPVAVGVEMEQVQKLRQVHLQDIPAKELYDGQTSIYEFAQIAFGGVIRLVEHFRCAPNIIAFSNTLSYNGEIKPLREASSISLTRHVLPYRVEDGRGKNDEVNSAEAEAIASLICAAIEQPEYASNADDKPMSFGVVSLVGGQQAMVVDALLRQRLEPAEYKNRRILCGQAAQFQGDERDVMFLSVVDSPPPEPPLPMRQEGPKKIFKKRFNVAASRARDQMWVVHSLNYETDLKPGDYRRRLIEHAVDPEAWEREFERRAAQIDPRSKEFEGGVLRLLMEKHFRVVPQYKVGSYRIDLVIVGSRKRLAVECDGERCHGPEKLQEDMERQAILERLGWQFVRVRGSIFFRDKERAMRPVFQRLDELGIAAELGSELEGASSTSDAVTQRVIRRAEELRTEWRADTITSR